jgi:hypothetical protein
MPHFTFPSLRVSGFLLQRIGEENPTFGSIKN